MRNNQQLLINNYCKNSGGFYYRRILEIVRTLQEFKAIEKLNLQY